MYEKARMITKDIASCPNLVDVGIIMCSYLLLLIFLYSMAVVVYYLLGSSLVLKLLLVGLFTNIYLTNYWWNV